MISARERFPPAVLVPVVVGALVGTAVPGSPPWALLVLLAAIAVRRVLLARASEWTGSEVWLAAWILVPVALASGIAAGLHQGMPTGGLVAGALTVLAAVSICAPPTAVGLVRLLALSAASVGVAAALVPTGPVVAGVTAYVAALSIALLDLERRRASRLPSGSRVSLRHVRACSAKAAAAPRIGRHALRLASVALPLALWLFVTLPTKPDMSQDPTGADESLPASARPTEDGVERREGGGGIPALDAFVSGARTKMRLDFVRRVQGDQRPVLLVRVGEGQDPGTGLLLRGMAYDRLAEDERGIPAWTRSGALAAGDRVVGPDAAEGEWIRLGLDPPESSHVRHVVRDLVGHAGGQLFLPPGPLRLRFDAELDDARLRVFPDGVVLGLGRLPAGRGYEVDAPGPGPSRRPTPQALSDASVAPLSAYVSSPPDAVALRRIARQIVGDATAPSDRADRIETWLRGLAYSKDMPKVDPRHPLVDFLTRVRAGHCEWFASSMAALLRSLGHPTRLVVGFRGGDFLATIGWVSFRGSHAHAWCETWFEGHGWVPYDPTPPDPRDSATGLPDPRRGTGTDGIDPDDADAGADGMSFVERLLRFSREDRRRLAGDAGRALGRARRAIERTVDRWVPGAGGFGVPVLLLAVIALALLLRARRRRRAGLGLAETRGGAAIPGGPYRRALSALAGIGLRRREAHTPTEHASRVASALPPAATALGALTSLHVRARYGERALSTAEQATAESAADAVQAAVNERRGGRAAPPLPGASPPG